MSDRPKQDVTRLLESWRGGNSRALDDLLPLVYEELRRLAASHLRQERSGHTLQATALVHEAYLRLSGGNPLELADRSHFFQLAAQAMRRILVDHARRHRANKRVGAHQQVSLDKAGELSASVDDSVLAVHDALKVLAKIQPRQAQLVEMRYFGGFSLEEVAEILDVSLSTLARDWRVARRWFYARLSENDHPKLSEDQKPAS